MRQDGSPLANKEGRDSGRHKGFAYVTFSSVEEAQIALRERRDIMLWDDYAAHTVRKLVIDHASELLTEPSSLDAGTVISEGESSAPSTNAYPVRKKATPSPRRKTPA